MLALRAGVFEEHMNLSDFLKNLESLFDNEDYSGRNGLEFVSEKAIENGYESDFDYHFDLVIEKAKKRDINLVSMDDEYIVKQFDLDEIKSFVEQMSELFEATLSLGETEYKISKLVYSGIVFFNLTYRIED